MPLFTSFFYLVLVLRLATLIWFELSLYLLGLALGWKLFPVLFRLGNMLFLFETTAFLKDSLTVGSIAALLWLKRAPPPTFWFCLLPIKWFGFTCFF